MKRVFLQFSFRQGWFCEFLEEDRKTPLPRTVTLADERKLFKLVKRGGFTLNISGRMFRSRSPELFTLPMSGQFATPQLLFAQYDY